MTFIKATACPCYRSGRGVGLRSPYRSVLTSAIVVARQCSSHKAGAQRACLCGLHWRDTPPQHDNGLPEAGTPATTRCWCTAPAWQPARSNARTRHGKGRRAATWGAAMALTAWLVPGEGTGVLLIGRASRRRFCARPWRAVSDIDRATAR